MFYEIFTDRWQTVNQGEGFELITDENGNGEPVFDLSTANGRRSLDLYKRLNNHNPNKKYNTVNG